MLQTWIETARTGERKLRLEKKTQPIARRDIDSLKLN